MKNIVLAGTVGKDATMRRTQAGEPVMTFSLAVDDGYGENKQTMWFDINLWGKRGDKIVHLLTKGKKVTVSGEFGARQHEAKTYFTCRANDITLQGGGEGKPARREPDDGDSYGSRMGNAMDDDIPFAPEGRG